MLELEKIVQTYYDALEEGKVLARRCTKCGHIEYPPYLACNDCGNLDTEWCEVPENVMLTQILPVSAMFVTPDFKKNVGDYFICSVQPENGFEVGSCLLNVKPEQFAEIEAKIPCKVKPIIVQEDGYKNVHWELAE